MFKIILSVFISILSIAAFAQPCSKQTFKMLATPGDAKNIVIDSAVMSGDNPGYCEVHGRIDTAFRSVIRFGMRLPNNWNHKFYMSGIGGYAGEVRFTDNNAPLALARGYAIAATDTGHQGSGLPVWALHNRLAQQNFAYRSIHLVSLRRNRLLNFIIRMFQPISILTVAQMAADRD